MHGFPWVNLELLTHIISNQQKLCISTNFSMDPRQQPWRLVSPTWLLFGSSRFGWAKAADLKICTKILDLCWSQKPSFQFYLAFSASYLDLFTLYGGEWWVVSCQQNGKVWQGRQGACQPRINIQVAKPCLNHCPKNCSWVGFLHRVPAQP